MDIILWGLTGSAVASGLIAGVFLSFSDFTMRSLRLAPTAAGAEAMQIINREVFRSIFIVLLIGMAPVSAMIGLSGVIWPPVTGQQWLVTGSLAYVIGTFGVTMLGNVPKNERLAALPDGSTQAQGYWPTYYSGWMFWNHVRTISATIATVSYLIAAMQIALAL